MTDKSKTDDINVPKIKSEKQATKPVIFAAYKKAMEKINQLNELAMNVDKTKKAAKTNAVISEAEKALDIDSIEVLVHQVEKFAETLSDELGLYTNIKQAIEAKEADLKEMFDIEKTAETLAALVDSQATIKAEFDSSMEERKRNLNDELETLRSLITSEKQEYKEEFKRMEEADKYSFDRMKKQRLDILEDELATKKKIATEALNEKFEELKAANKELDEREQAINAQIDEIAELRAQVAEFPSKLDSAIKAAVGKEKGMLEAHYKRETEFLSATSSSTTEVANAKVQELNKLVAVLEASNKEMQGKLESAYREIKEMAVKTVEGIGSQKMIQDLMQKIGDGTNKK